MIDGVQGRRIGKPDYCVVTPRLTFVDLNRVTHDLQGEPRLELYREDKLHFQPAAYVAFTAALKPILQNTWAEVSPGPLPVWSEAAQLPLAILGGIIGSNSTKAALAQLGASFAVNSILLKYSRTAESQADILGTQILYDSGYDPPAMAQFFEKIEDEQRRGGPVEFFSNHPSPDNRIERVNQEVSALGGVRRDSVTSSRDFDGIKRYLQSLPGPRAGGRLQSSDNRRQPGGVPGSTPDWPEEWLGSQRNGVQDRF